jgi:hypothetical protein
MNRRVKLSFAIVGLLSLSLTAVSAFRQEVKLAYQWPKGETLRYRVTQEVNTSMSGLPGMGDASFDQTTTQVLSIVAETIAPDGTTTLRQVIDSVRMEMGTPMGKMGFDSTNPTALQDPTGLMKDMFSAMVGEPITVVAAPTGRIEKVEGMSAVMEKVLKKLPQNPGSGPIMDALKNSLSDEAMRGLLSQGFAQLPAKPVRMGETWTGELKTTNPAIGVLVTSMTSTLKSLEGSGDAQLAKVDLKLTMKQEAGSAAPNPLGMTLKMGNAAGTGELTFNVPKGRVVRSSIVIDMPYAMSGTAPDGTAMNLTSKSKSTTTIEAMEK